MKFLRHFPFLLLVVFTTVFHAACTPKVVPSTVESWPVSPEVEEALLDRLQANARAFDSLEGMAKVRVVCGERSLSLTQVLLAEKPDHLRAETLNPFGFGQPLLLMATNGRELAVMVPAEGQVYRGEASQQNLQRFTRLPLQLRDLVHILLYQIPLIPHRERVFSGHPSGGYRLVLEGAEAQRQEISFNSAMQLVETAYFVNEELALRVKYDTFSEGEQPFPQVAFLEMPGQQAEAHLSFSEVRTNIVPDTSRFSLATPPGYQERPIP